MKVTAQDIKYVLSVKHREDFFLTEVKNGSTWSSRELAIMDGLAIKKSWAKPCLTGYEIKVSRSDFMNDEKWPVYKELCHRFYFACPTGLIQAEELPDDVGLVWFNPEKKTLYTRKKAKFRDIEMSADLFYYIILSRLENEKHPFFSSQRELLEQYVIDKASRYELGRRVGSKLMKDLVDLEKQNQEMKRKLERLEQNEIDFKRFQGVMRKNGLNSYRWNAAEELDEALSTSVPPKFIETVQSIQNSCNRLSEMVQK
ncbi:MmcB family DNA repair protein [Bacillus sp. FJAT-49736]|uniref:MmcB family DNA repair protein n=1 Tax=Bacillus sp. FJAT-49736 TaxID=2833582 RepID=UPI001BCA194A|nr:MmcB family DNA repair protein [Bacillus sp. FJAT-49736]MBS4172102.1 MmcB family DNA repair protein [Bacillus sp. FJAT-49736]